MKSIARTALPVLRSTRSILMPHFGNAEVIEHKGGYAHDYQTRLDCEAEHYLRRELQSAFPDIGFVGEEEGGDRTQERFFLCDPIDGTMQYVRGLPLCTSMLALIENHRVVFGAIYDFVLDRMYYAELGNGAYCNDVRMQVSGRPMEQALIACEINPRDDEAWALCRGLKQKGQLIDTWTAGHELAHVARGAYEARITWRPWGKDWDYAPGSLIVSEAGGKVANIGRRTYDYRDTDFIAASPNVFAALTEGVHALFPIDR